MSSSPDPDREANTRRHRTLAGIGAALMITAAAVLALAADAGGLSLTWRTGLTALGVYAGAFLAVWSARPAWFSRWGLALCGLMSIVVVTAAVVFFSPDAPAAPPRILGNPTADSVVLSWPPSADDARVQAYEVYRDGTRIYSGRLTTYVDRAVEPGKTYDYIVVAVGNDGIRSPEQKVSVRTATRTTRLAPPPLLRAQALRPQSVLLTWTAPPSATDLTPYEVIRDAVKIGTAGTVDFVDDSVQPDTTYTYTVRTYDPSTMEESADSATATVRTPSVPTTPTQRSGPNPNAGRTPSPPKTTPPKPPTSAPPPPPCSGDLVPGTWHLAATDDADEVSEGTPDDVLRGRATVRIRFDLHGLDARTGGDDGVVIFNQDNDWFTANLAVWGNNGHDGAQTVTIPVGEFRRVSNGDPIDPNADVPSVRARFWHEGAWSVDIFSVEVCG